MLMMNPFSRREFLVASAGLAACASQGASPVASPVPSRLNLPAGARILFQGDSITDVGRSRTTTMANASQALGYGYPLLIAAAVLRTNPTQQFQFSNRGISGNRVPHLEARCQADALDLKPDLLSILIGVNDFWHTKQGTYTGTAGDYEAGYTKLLETTRQALPKVTLVILEPFLLSHGVVTPQWRAEFQERQVMASRVAAKAGAIFVPLQRTLDQLSADGSAATWTSDGVHPTLAGHAVIAERWRAA